MKKLSGPDQQYVKMFASNRTKHSKDAALEFFRRRAGELNDTSLKLHVEDKYLGFFEEIREELKGEVKLSF